MLVLSRKKSETITITDTDGKRIWLTVVDIRGDKVRLGLTAPGTVKIHRQEMQDKIDRDARETDRQKQEACSG